MTEIYLAENHLLLKTGYGNPEMHSHSACHVLVGLQGVIDKEVSRIESKVPALKKRQRVAAYARVSMETDRLAHSLSAQVSYYNELIQGNPEWEYAGVYADFGISGTGTAARSEFLRLISDCEERYGCIA